jgi:hypothetical protein
MALADGYRLTCRRGEPHVSRFERGDLRALRNIAKQAPPLIPEVKIFVVQPGLSQVNTGAGPCHEPPE